MQTSLPVLFSFRRCPYAMRARMALACAGVVVELREVLLREPPGELLRCSPKGTVPVLVLPDGSVLDESLDIMHWALVQHDPEHWLPAAAAGKDCTGRLIAWNDAAFKQDLDRYKYAVRHPENPPAVYRARGAEFLEHLEGCLQSQDGLCGPQIGLADVAIFPFVRQFAGVDADWFAAAPWPRLQHWLLRLVDSRRFAGVMHRYPRWQPGNAALTFPLRE